MGNDTNSIGIEMSFPQSKDLILTILNTQDALVVVLDISGKLVFFNKKCETLTGYQASEVIGDIFWEIFLLSEEKEAVKKVFMELKAGMFPNQHTNYWIDKKGTKYLIQWSNSAIIDSNGNVKYIIGTGIDITKQQAAEEEIKLHRDHLQKLVEIRTKALLESERKYQDLYDNAPDMFVSVDAKTANILQCNQTLADELGYTKEEILGRSVFDLYATDSVEYAKSHVFQTFVKTGTVKDEELQLQRKDGSVIDVSLNVSAIRDEKGNILQSRSVWRDITKRKLMESEVKTLSGLLPICASCKKIRDDKGYWNQIESYIHKHSEAQFSHGICPECAKKYYPDLEP